VYNFNNEALVSDRRIIRFNEANKIIQNDLKNRFVEYLKSPFFDSVMERIDESIGEFVGYSPNFILAQIFSNPKTFKSLIEDPTNKNLYNLYYEEGWNNFYDFINTVNLDEKNKKALGEPIKKMKNFIKAFIDNNYKPISKSQYDKIWDDLPF